MPKGLKYSLQSITPEQLEDLQVVIREQTANSLAYVADSYDPLIVASAYLSIVRQIYMLYLKKEEAETLFEWAKINMDPKTKEAHLH